MALADNETRLVVSASRTDLLKQADDGTAVLTRLAGVLGMKPEDVTDKVRLCDAETPKPCWNGSPYQPIPITDEATTQQALQIWSAARTSPASPPSPPPCAATPRPARPTPPRCSATSRPVTDDEISASEKTSRRCCAPTRSAAPAWSATYDKQLRGKAGVTRYEVDNLGRVIGKAERRPGRHPAPTSSPASTPRSRRSPRSELNEAMKDARKTYDTHHRRELQGRLRRRRRHGGQDRPRRRHGQPARPTTPTPGSAASPARTTRAHRQEVQLPAAEPGDPGPVRARAPPSRSISTAAAINAGYSFDGPYACTSS